LRRGRQHARRTLRQPSQFVRGREGSETLEQALDEIDLGLRERRAEPNAPCRDLVSARRLDHIVARRAGEIRVVDFTLDLRTGEWSETPLEQVNGLLVQMAQQYVIDKLMAIELRAILAAGVAPIRDRITAGLTNESTLADLGIEIATVRVAGLAAESDVQRALQQPTREAIQQKADEATFARREQAVEKERAIAENELANKIELARREEDLVAREGTNERRRAEEQAGAGAITAEATDQTERMAAKRRTDAIRDLEAAKLDAERQRAEINAGLGVQILVALAARELAGQVGQVEHLMVTPDLITPLLGKLTARGPEA